MWKLITEKDNNIRCKRDKESSEGLRVGRYLDVTCFCEVRLHVIHTGVVLPNPIPCPDAHKYTHTHILQMLLTQMEPAKVFKICRTEFQALRPGEKSLPM